MTTCSTSKQFDHIIGNEKIKTYFTKLINSGNIPQSLLFSGPEGVGKSLFADAFAKLLVETENAHHPDIHHYHPEGKIGMHSIQSMREFSKTVYLAPFQAQKKVFIIHDAHRMLSYSANALLKTFEEPALDSVIILITEAPERLLPTVLSRCQTIRFQPLSNEEIANYLVIERNFSKEDAETLSFKARGSLGKALSDSNSTQHPTRELLLNLLSTGQLHSYSNIVAFSKEFSDHIDGQMSEAEEALQSQMIEAFSDKPTAQQKQMIEKEVEGAVSLKKSSEAKFLFNILLSWYRDLHLLNVSGDHSFLINSDYKHQLVQSLQRGEILSFEKVQEAVSEAILALERSTSVNLCLESLFLKLM